MIRNVTLSALLSLWPALAAAQTAPLPSVESVVVTGTKSPQALKAFVGSIAVPTRLIGKLARWGTPICPLVTGVNDDAVIAEVDVAQSFGDARAMRNEVLKESD